MPSSFRPPIRVLNICVVGLWHQACVLSAAFAEMGHFVVGVGNDEVALNSLRRGKAPLYEPRLDAMLRRNIKAGRLRYTDDFADALANAELVFVAIDTPVTDQDEPELEVVLQAARNIGRFRSGDITLCVTSQVPVGTSEKMAASVRESAGSCDVVYIPEFLRLGEALDTFFHADRFILGAKDLAVANRVADLYRPLQRPVLVTDLRSAEMAKHACNAYLATSISFINEIADICDRLGADAIEVGRAMKSDRRIGPYAFLTPGLGFAGGTLGRDLRALQRLGREQDLRTRLIDAVVSVNGSRAGLVSRKLSATFGSVKGLHIGVLGLTYKPGTSTLRRSMALEIISQLLEDGALVAAFDPLADLSEIDALPPFEISSDPYALAEDCDALVLTTEWTGIRELDFKRLRKAMRGSVFVDTRNLFDPAEMERLGFSYSGIGRGNVRLSAATNSASSGGN